MDYVDIHSHILPEVDDGARSMEESIAMLEMAYEEGIRTIFATPHYGVPGLDIDIDDCKAKVQSLRAYIEGHPELEGMKIHLGNEILYHTGVSNEIKEGKALTLGSSNYVLIEFYTSADYSVLTACAHEMKMAGYSPIYAHIERYHCLREKPSRVETLRAEGVRMQVNAASILRARQILESDSKESMEKAKKSKPGSKIPNQEGINRALCAWDLMNAGLVDYVATDSHRSDRRKPIMASALEKKSGSTMAALLESIQSAILNGKPIWNDDPEVYNLANRHDLAHLVNQDKMMEAVYRYSLQEKALADTTKILEDAGIEYVLLKGAVIRNLYPEPWMRTSVDLDILIRQEKLNLGENALEQNGYVLLGRSNNHSVYESPDKVTIELHYALTKATTSQQTAVVLDRIWDNPNDPAMFYCHFIAHMAGHVKTGGCGMRSIIDAYLLRNYDKSLVREAGLEKFEEAVQNLARKWLLNSNNIFDVDPNFENWIVNGGVYGTIEQATQARTSRTTANKALTHRLFPNFEEMKIYFPEIRSKAELPRYWGKRVIKHTSRFGTTRIRNELRHAKNIDAVTQANVRAMFDKLGI